MVTYQEFELRAALSELDLRVNAPWNRQNLFMATLHLFLKKDHKRDANLDPITSGVLINTVSPIYIEICSRSSLIPNAASLTVYLIRYSELERSLLIKREGTRGYFIKDAEDPTIEAPSKVSDSKDRELDEAPADHERSEEDFRREVIKYYKNKSYETPGAFYPLRIPHEKAKRTGDSQWMYPDVIVVEWDATVLDQENAERLDKNAVALRSHAGQSSFKVLSIELKPEIYNVNQARQFFFQALSNSSWAHEGILAIRGMPDKAVMEELRMLGTIYNVTVIYFEGEDKKFGSEKIISKAKDIRASVEWNRFDKLVERLTEFKLLKHSLSLCLEKLEHLAFDRMLKKWGEGQFSEDKELMEKLKEITERAQENHSLARVTEDYDQTGMKRAV